MKIAWRKKKSRKFTKREISRFCGQLKMLLASGVPLLEAFQIIQTISPRQEFGLVVQRLSEGESLAEVLKNFLPSLVISSIKGAEQAGDLENVLARLSVYYENRAEVEDKVKSAMVYPAFVVGLCLLSFMVLIVFVLPGFKGLFADFEADLPLFTRIIMGSGEIVSRTWYWPLTFAVLAGLLLKNYCKTEKGALLIDEKLLKFAPLRRELMVQSFRTLGSLLHGGIPIGRALKTTVDSTTNRAYQKIVRQIKDELEKGERLSRILEKQKLFPPEAVRMIAVGENSGNLAAMLLNIADFYEKEREQLLKKFVILLEPALTLAVGVVVGIIALAMFLPMMNMLSTLQ